jgi:hypothetical protein
MTLTIRMACQIIYARVAFMQKPDNSAIKNEEYSIGGKRKCNYRFKKIGLLTK